MPQLTVKKKVPGIMLDPGEVIVVGKNKAERLLKRFKRFLAPSQAGDEEYVPDWGPDITQDQRAELKSKTWPLSPEERRKFKKPEPPKGPTVENRVGTPGHVR